MPLLVVVGIDEHGQREVLAFCVGEREELKGRGVEQVDLWITDGNQAMLNAIHNKFPTARRQRCIQHKMDNVLAYVPQKQQEAVRAELKAIFYQESRAQAEQELA